MSICQLYVWSHSFIIFIAFHAFHSFFVIIHFHILHRHQLLLFIFVECIFLFPGVVCEYFSEVFETDSIIFVKVCNLFEDLLFVRFDGSELKFFEYILECFNCEVSCVLHVKQIEGLLDCIKLFNLGASEEII